MTDEIENKEVDAKIEQLADDLRLEILQLDDEKSALEKELGKKLAFLQQYQAAGVDDEGFPDKEYPHMEVAEAKMQVSEIEQRLKNIDASVEQKMGLYFSMAK